MLLANETVTMLQYLTTEIVTPFMRYYYYYRD